MQTEKLDKDKVIAMIEKILRKTTANGCTEAEEASAMAVAQSMLRKYGLSMLDIERSKLEEAGFGVKQDPFDSVYQNLPPWAKLLALHMAEAFDVKLVLSSMWDDKQKKVRARLLFIGQEADTAVAKYFYVRLADELYAKASQKGISRGHRGKDLTSYRIEFIQAASYEIKKRLLEINKENSKKRSDEENRREGAMIELKSGLIEDYVANLFPDLRHTTINTRHGAGTRDGVLEGRTIDLEMNRVPGQVEKPQRIQ